MNPTLRKPSPAMVVALLALFVALSGTAVAAVQLKRDSVQSKHIKNGQVKRQDLANASVNSTKVRDGSLRLRDFPAGELPAGPAGRDGAPGARGPQGPRGLAGASGGDHETLHYITNAQLLNGFTVYPGANWAAPSYWKDDAGVVHMQGLLDPPTNANNSFYVLPAGYRPCDPSGPRGGDLLFVVEGGDQDSRLDINTAGTMTIYRQSGAHLSLSGVSFPTRNCG